MEIVTQSLALTSLLNFLDRTLLSVGRDLRHVSLLYDDQGEDVASSILSNLHKSQILNVSYANNNIRDINKHVTPISNKNATASKTILLAVLFHVNFMDQINDAIGANGTLYKRRIEIIIILKHSYSKEALHTFLKEFNRFPIVLINWLDGILITCRNDWLPQKIVTEYKDIDFPVNGNVKIYEKIFSSKFRQVNKHEIVVMASHNPPQSYNLSEPLNSALPMTKSTIAGSDIWLTELLGNHVNATMRYKLPRYAYTEEYVSRFFREYKEVTHRVPNIGKEKLIEYYNVSNLKSVMGNASEHIALPHFRGPVETLNAHGYMNYVIVVPNIQKTSSVIWRLLARSPLLIVWTLNICVFTILRKIFQKLLENDSCKSISDILFDTIGISFSVGTGLKIGNRPERILVVILSLVAIVANTTCSGMLFGKFATSSYEPVIKTLQDLEDSGITIYMSLTMSAANAEYWNKTLKNCVKQEREYRVVSKIWDKNTDNAYIIPETSIDIIKSERLLDENGIPLFHILKQSFIGEAQSMCISPWYFREVANKVIRRAVEHGLLVYFERTSAMLLHRDRSTTIDSYQSMANTLNGLSITDIQFSFIIFGIGNGIAGVVFLVELLYIFYLKLLARHRSRCMLLVKKLKKYLLK